MAEYIEKEAILSNLIDQIEKGRDTAECEATELVIKRFAEYIKSFPAADVQPVKYGRWDGYICSECNVCADYFISGDFYFDERPTFYPNCGAKMIP